MKDQHLFGIIALLMVLIVVIGAADVIERARPVSTPIATLPTTYTRADVEAHNSAASCYTTINGSVYDLTEWINQHPGGPEAILSLCGTDGTAAFEAQHGGQARPEEELASLKIGTLAP